MRNSIILKSSDNKLAAILLLVVFVIIGHSAPVLAQPSSTEINNSFSCSNLNGDYVSVVLSSIPTSGELYVKSPLNQTPGSTTLYFQSYSSGQCINLGTVTPNTSSWTALGSLPSGQQFSQGGSFIAESPNIGSAPYEAALQLLILPSPSICSPTTTCMTTYQGWSGALDPTIISGATDQIAVYVAKPLSGSSIIGVNYYNNQKFLYSSPQLQNPNRDYLSGGSHVITAIASFKNGEQLVVTQPVNMGVDYSGYLWLRSSLYNSKDKGLFVLKIIGIVALLGVLILLIRHIRKKLLYKKTHGLNDYKNNKQNKSNPPADENNPTNTIVVG